MSDGGVSTEMWLRTLAREKQRDVAECTRLIAFATRAGRYIDFGRNQTFSRILGYDGMEVAENDNQVLPYHFWWFVVTVSHEGTSQASPLAAEALQKRIDPRSFLAKILLWRDLSRTLLLLVLAATRKNPSNHATNGYIPISSTMCKPSHDLPPRRVSKIRSSTFQR